MNRCTHHVMVGLAALGLSAIALAQSLSGEVMKVDRAQGKLTLKHGPIQSLGLPAMSMSYRVEEPRWLDSVRVGDHVRFDADKVGGQFTVTRLTPQR